MNIVAILMVPPPLAALTGMLTNVIQGLRGLFGDHTRPVRRSC